MTSLPPAFLRAPLQGWTDEPQEVEFKDGSTWYCPEKCSKATRPIYEPTLFDPETGACTRGVWSLLCATSVPGGFRGGREAWCAWN